MIPASSATVGERVAGRSTKASRPSAPAIADRVTVVVLSGRLVR
jgi:hypothetical protein